MGVRGAVVSSAHVKIKAEYPQLEYDWNSSSGEEGNTGCDKEGVR